MDASTRLDRVTALLGRSRFDLAAQETRLIIAEDPNDGEAHALLAICLSNLGQLSEATEEAELALHLLPDESFSHYAHARVLADRERWREAEQAIRRAIEFDPYDEDQFSLLATILMNQEKWREALAAAEEGLEEDPEHVDCVNLRAMALRRLGQDAEAGTTLRTALEHDPEDEMTHFNLAWSYVESGEKEKALEHFREALRLDPEFDAAREGMIDAINSRNPLYRVMLATGAWITKQTKTMQWSVIGAAIVGYILLDQIAEASPLLGYILRPVLYLALAFCMLLWMGDMFFKVLLRFNRDGRKILSPDEIAETNWAIVFLIPAGVFLALEAIFPGRAFIMRAVLLGFFVVLVAAVYECPPGWSRNRMTLIALGIGAMGFGAIMCLFFLPWMPYGARSSLIDIGRVLGIGFLLTGMFTDEISAWIRRRSPTL